MNTERNKALFWAAFTLIWLSILALAPRSNADPVADAIDRQTKAIERQTQAIERAATPQTLMPAPMIQPIPERSTSYRWGDRIGDRGLTPPSTELRTRQPDPGIQRLRDTTRQLEGPRTHHLNNGNVVPNMEVYRNED